MVRLGPSGSRESSSEGNQGRVRGIQPRRKKKKIITWSAISSALESISCEITIVVRRLSKTEKIYPCTHQRTHVRARKWHGTARSSATRHSAARLGGHEGERSSAERGAQSSDEWRGCGGPICARSRPRECDVEIGCARSTSGVRGRRVRAGAVCRRIRFAGIRWDSRRQPSYARVRREVLPPASSSIARRIWELRVMRLVRPRIVCRMYLSRYHFCILELYF